MEELNETGVETTYQLISSALALDTKFRLKLNSAKSFVIHGPKYVHQAAIMSCARKTIEKRVPRNEIRIHSSINCEQMASVNVKMVDHLIITENWLCGGLYITTGISCLQPCFPRCFGYCIFQWTRRPERLSYQSVISRNSTAVTHCRVMMSFYTETTAFQRQV